MRRLASSCVVVVALCTFAPRGQALTRRADDMCSQPTMKTDKWQRHHEIAGMSLLIPPGFIARGGSSVESDYLNGEHKSISVGEGGGTALQRYRDVSETGECETVIGRRRVTITMYHWVVEDAALSASGEAGAHFGAVARYYAVGALREVYVQLVSNAPSDVKYFRQLFWTVSFDGDPESPATSPPASPGAQATLVAAAPAAGVSPAAPPAECAAMTGLPTPDAVLDSSVVRILIAGAAPIPKGYEVMALQFAGTGELSGMSVAQSDLPESSQHELSAVVATNLKPHDAHAPPAFLLRIDSSDTGLRYAVLPMSACSH